MRKTRILEVTETLDEPNLLDCPLLGCSALYCQWGRRSVMEPAVIFNALAYGPDSKQEMTTNVVVLQDHIETGRGVAPMSINLNSINLIPIENNTPQSRTIARHIFVLAAEELNLIREGKTNGEVEELEKKRAADHHLIGAPCIFQGMPALPFMSEQTIEPADPANEVFSESLVNLLHFFVQEPSVFKIGELDLKVRNVFTEDADNLIIPMKKDTRQARKAYADLVFHLVELLNEKRDPKKKKVSSRRERVRA